MHHSRAEYLHPAGALAARTSRPVTQLALHVHLRRGLGEREVAGTEPRLRLAEEAIGEMGECRLEIDEADAFVDRQSLDLGEHRRVGRVEEVTTVCVAGTQNPDRWLELLHGADLHRRRVRP